LVSATHQSEEIMDASNAGEYVDGQFRSTRDAETVFGPLETWIWGGMDTQLEHHLFPTMPRYNYHKLRPILKAWAKAQGILYRSSPSTTIISDNWKLLDKIAHQA
jgi:fatty acid desaturase